MKKKILHIISSPSWRGGEQQVDFLFNYESSIYQTYLFCPENAIIIDRNKEKYSKIFTYKKRFGFDILAALNLKKINKQEQFDIIHLHDSHAINTYLIATYLGINIPCVIHRHVNFSITNKWKYKHKNIQQIICVSEQVKQHLSTFIDKNKLVVVHPGIDVQKFLNSGINNHLKKELNLSDETKIIGIVSALEKEKNIDEFIRIANKLIIDNKNHHFVIIGDGSLKSEYSSLNTQIHMLGFRNDVPELLSSLNLFLFTSKNEGFPLVLLEAMASKVSVLSSNFQSAKESIEHEKTGYIYNNIDKAVELCNNILTKQDFQHSTIENAFRFVQQFDVSLMNQKIETIYQSIFTHE